MLIFNELQMCAKTIKIKTDFQQVRAIDSNKETEEREETQEREGMTQTTMLIATSLSSLSSLKARRALLDVAISGFHRFW